MAHGFKVDMLTGRASLRRPARGAKLSVASGPEANPGQRVGVEVRAQLADEDRQRQQR